MVSIHAPARGATKNNFHPLTHPRFQSTHPRGVRPPYQKFYLNLLPFQSTHPRGVRLLYLGVLFQAHLFQSTHPRGVRRYGKCFNNRGNFSFNPRTREGCDYSCSVILIFPGIVFQSTHPRGVRRGLLWTVFCRADTSFNPRTREGCDAPSPGRK